MLNILAYTRIAPWVISAAMAMYGIHAGSMHSADKRAIEALNGQLKELSRQRDELDTALDQARVDAGRIEGLQADLAGTRGYLKQVQAAQRAQASGLQACRRELREVSARFDRERQAWALMPSRQGGGR